MTRITSAYLLSTGIGPHDDDGEESENTKFGPYDDDGGEEPENTKFGPYDDDGGEGEDQ